MTTEEQQVLFHQTRARIQENLNEVAQLAHNSFDGKAFFPRFLRLLTDSLSAEGGALWIPNERGFEQIAAVNFASSRFEDSPAQRRAIEAVLTQIGQNRQPLIVAAADRTFNTQSIGNDENASNLTHFPFFYVPISLGEKLVLVVQIWLREAGDPHSYQEISAFINTWASHALIFLRNHQGAVAASKNEEFAHLLQMQSSLLGELNPKEVSSVIVNYTSDLTRADLVCLFRKRGKKWQLVSASNQEKIDEKSQQSQRLVALAGDLGAAEKSQLFFLPSESNDLIKTHLESLGYAQVIWREVKAPKSTHSHLLCALRHEDQSFPTNAPDLVDRVTESSGVALETAYHYHALPFRPILGSVSRISNEWQTNRRKRIFVFLGILAVTLVVLLAIPVPLKISAECTVEPRVMAVAVAEASGKIKEVLVSESQEVSKDQLLARMDDQDYVTQLAVAEQEKLRWQVESARAQTTGNEAERKLAEINFQRQAEAINRLKYLRSKTEIRAPIEGVILTKNLQNREGETVETGTAFLELSGNKDYQLVLFIKQTDIGDLLRAWRENPNLPVDFILHSNAQVTVSTQMTADTLISEVPEMRKDHGYYRVNLPVPASDAILKPGYTGKAKIRIGSSSILYNWFRPFLNYWRVEWGV